MKTERLKEQSMQLAQSLLECSELRISTNNGAIHINASTMDYTYLGQFGSNVLNSIIKAGVINNEADKIMVLAAHIMAYSENIGGVTITKLTTKNKTL